MREEARRDGEKKQNLQRDEMKKRRR